MTTNPYGASCGTSIVKSPTKVQASPRGIGSKGARLEAMSRHPAGKGLITTYTPEATARIMAEAEALLAPARAKLSAEVKKNLADEAKREKQARIAAAEHLKLIGDGDA